MPRRKSGSQRVLLAVWPELASMCQLFRYLPMADILMSCLAARYSTPSPARGVMSEW